jgi:PIN domain nuclease of toxin-antitoxin system
MRILLDTHTLLWYALDDPSLSAVARSRVIDPANDVLISPASYWEIAIKLSVGKLTLIEPYEQFMDDAVRGNGFQVMPILVSHTAVVATLPFHHRDPFDRLLVAQALAENIPLVSRDADLDAYGVQRLW